METATEKTQNYKLQLLEQLKQHDTFCKALIDAYVLVDPDGKVIKCNVMLGQMLGLKSKQILKSENLSDVVTFLYKGNEYTPAELMANLVSVRFDDVIGITKTGPQKGDRSNLILGLHRFKDDQGTLLGGFYVIRNITAETQLEFKYKEREVESITDSLTKLFNRNYLEEFMQREVTQLKSCNPEEFERSNFSLAMLDIDHFKGVNDTFGHQAGDYVLRTLGSIMTKCMRKSDVSCRYGGEEFTIILPQTNLKGAQIALQKLRIEVENYKFMYDKKVIPVTISIGLAPYVSGQTIDEVMANADSALYEAKETGRNRLITFQPQHSDEKKPA